MIIAEQSELRFLLGVYLHVQFYVLYVPFSLSIHRVLYFR